MVCSSNKEYKKKRIDTYNSVYRPFARHEDTLIINYADGGLDHKDKPTYREFALYDPDFNSVIPLLSTPQV